MSEEKNIIADTNVSTAVADKQANADRAEAVAASGKRPKRRRRKVVLNLKCALCESGVGKVSYKDVYQLKKYTSVRGKIISTEKSGVCNKHQRQLSNAIKRARFLALLPYMSAE